MELIKAFQDVYYGGIYSDTYEKFSDGGPICYNSMTNELRIGIAILSGTINSIIMYYSWKRITRSKELDLTLVKNLSPSIWEKLIGYSCLITYFVMCCYKFYTKRGIFMQNPCHYVCLFSGILLVTKKTKLTAVVFISYLRWLYGPYSALAFPVTNGLDLPFEVEFFWIEHYLAAFIGPLALIIFGRYGFFNESFWTLIVHQYFGFGTHIIYQRIWMTPQSILTWANLNFTLCYPESDPTVKIWGNYYLYMADHYLNFGSFLIVLIVILQSKIILAPVKIIKSLTGKRDKIE